MATGEATVNELTEPFGITLQAVSKHLKVLQAQAGFNSSLDRFAAYVTSLRPDMR